jgi:hypothetical protein
LSRYVNLLAGPDGEFQVMQHIREVRLMTRNETKMSTRETIMTTYGISNYEIFAHYVSLGWP